MSTSVPNTIITVPIPISVLDAEANMALQENLGSGYGSAIKVVTP